MGLDIGIISIQYLDRPDGHAYDFAWRLAEEANVNGYMGGESNSWGGFEKEHVRQMLEDFAEARDWTDREESEVWAWVESLPWEGDTIELHFN